MALRSDHTVLHCRAEDVENSHLETSPPTALAAQSTNKNALMASSLSFAHINAQAEFPSSKAAAVASGLSPAHSSPPTSCISDATGIDSEHIADRLPLNDEVAPPAEPTGSCDEPSRLMALPRELRDQIYDQLHHDTDLETYISPSKKGNRLRVCFAPYTALLHISKRFSTEYTDRISKRTILRVRDVCSAPVDEATDYALLLPLKFIRHIEIATLSAMDGDNDAVIRAAEVRCGAWIERVRSLSDRICGICIIINLWAMSEKNYNPEALQAKIQSARDHPSYGVPKDIFSKNEGFLGSLIGCHAVKRVKVQCVVGYKTEQTTKIYGTWTAKQGWDAKLG